MVIPTLPPPRTAEYDSDGNTITPNDSVSSFHRRSLDSLHLRRPPDMPNDNRVTSDSDAPYAEEPEPLSTQASPGSPSLIFSPRQLSSSPTTSRVASPTQNRLYSADSGVYPQRSATISIKQQDLPRSNTRRSTTTPLSLPPKLAHDPKGGPPRPTLFRGLSVSVSSATGIGISDIGDPEALEGFWQIYAKEAFQADRRMIAAWNRSLDVRLLFSGIFSAILTPFILESYKLLEGTSNDDLFKQGGYRVRVNATWIGSLIVSLIAALLSIHCKQWLDGYHIDMHFAAGPNYASAVQRTSRLRQYRYESLQNYYIHQVIGLLPVLLYVSLLLFAIGLIDLLWQLNQGIAIYVSSLCGVVVVFHVFTTVLPFFTTRTPYRTPLSDFLGNLWRGMLRGEIAIKGLMEEEERRDVESLGDRLDEKCTQWLQKTTESEEYYKIAMRAQKELQRQRAVCNMYKSS